MPLGSIKEEKQQLKLYRSSNISVGREIELKCPTVYGRLTLL